MNPLERACRMVAQGMSCEDAAERCGVPAASVYKIRIERQRADLQIWKSNRARKRPDGGAPRGQIDPRA